MRTRPSRVPLSDCLLTASVGGRSPSAELSCPVAQWKVTVATR